MHFIQRHFQEFLLQYDIAKLGFIVSQSNVETYVRTEFAWYIEDKLNKTRRYEIYVELNRIDLQVYDTQEDINYIIELGHHVNLHKLNIEEAFEKKRRSDRAKLPDKSITNRRSVQFVHINMLTNFAINEDTIVHIEQAAATYKKYGNRNKSSNFLSSQDISHFEFTWKNSRGNLVVQVMSEIV